MRGLDAMFGPGAPVQGAGCGFVVPSLDFLIYFNALPAFPSSGRKDLKSREDCLRGLRDPRWADSILSPSASVGKHMAQDVLAQSNNVPFWIQEGR